MDENEQELKSVKAAGDYTLSVLGAPFGGHNHGKDADGEYFSQRTNIYSDQFPTVPVFYYHGMTPEGQPQGSPEVIGTAKYDRLDEHGHWYTVTLNKASEYARRVWEAAQKGLARASSGAIAHLVRKAANGEILEWALAELSVFDIGAGRQPANQYAVALPAAKSHYQAAGLDLQGDYTMSDEKKADFNITGGSISLEAMEAAVEAAVEKRMKAQADEAQAKAAEAQRIDDAVKAERVKWEAEAAKANRLPNMGSAPYQAKFQETWKYDNLDAADLSLTASILQSRDKPVSPAALKALAFKIAELKDANTIETRDAVNYVKGAFKASTGINPTPDAIKGVTDPMLTTGTTDGGNWVIPAYSAELWRVIRAENKVVANIPSVVIPDGYPSDVFPIEGTDPTWYKVAEVTTSANPAPDATVTASQITTPTKITLSVAKAGARVLYSGEMTEDSIIPFVAQLRDQLNISGAEMMENVAINGDTTASIANINDSNSGGGGAAGTEIFCLLNGFRKLAITTNSANLRTGGAITEDDFLETMWLMGTAGLAGSDLAKCAFVIDPNVYKKALQMATVKTKDIWTNATMESGALTKLWGYNVIPSWQFCANSAVRKSQATGKIDIDTTANNVYGSILGIRWDQWKLGYKRRTTIETTRFANSDSWEIVALTRFGLAYRDIEAAAISVGLTV